MGKKFTLSLLLIAMLISASQAQQLAFPGAEGYGKYTVGGRGGAVIEVTNLNDSGAGSLRAAVEASGPRTVVFRVSGTIILNSELKISNGYITIAGQTAPGDGICIRRYPIVIGANNVIIRYIRVRFGDESGDDDDAISSRFTNYVMLDHVSASWSVDETMSVYHCDFVTIQWCLISESLYQSNHVKGHHGFGGIWGSNYSSSHHNLIADHSSRNPRMASGAGNFDYRNNVIYNWGYNSCYGGEQQQVGDPDHAFTNINMVANYYKPGPATQPGSCTYRIANPSYRDVKTDYGKWYIADNTMVGNSAVTADNWNGGVQPQGGEGDIQYVKLDEPWPSMPIDQQKADSAYFSVLDNAGATLPKRDIVDTRIVNDTRNGIATFEGPTYKNDQSVPDKTKICGIIDSQTDVGGWPELKSTPAPTDTDHDGMPDDWENAKGLNPNNKDDGNIVGPDGYTNLEKYLNSIEFLNPVDGYKLTELSGTSYKLEWADNYLAEDGFRVERSNNGGDFEVIANLPKYSNNYTDNSAPEGTLTYRVIAYNSDIESPANGGISNVSNSANKISTLGETRINCYPNPVHDDLTLKLTENIQYGASFTISDLLGKKIMTNTLAGINSVIDMKDLPNGIYFLIVTNGKENLTRKIIKK